MADQIEEVKQKTDIVSLIGSYVDLKKAGKNFKANCPFHSERTPSFMVSPELQIYKCFGCGESGDAFTFLEKKEGMVFSEALSFLAEKAGVKLTSIDPKAKSEKEKLMGINKEASRFYQYVLLKHAVGKRALDYLLKERGLKMATIKEFGLGYSPNSAGTLKKFLVDKKKFNAGDLEKAGLVYRRGVSLIDRFGGRVVFPLFDHRGALTGFSGRVLPDEKKEKAKYINTPETPLYHKSNLLYGLNLTRDEVKKKKKAIVVEGELDVISSWQRGVKNVVATKGTALTEEQVGLIARFAEGIVLALDADFAGDSAALRGIGIAQGAGLEVSVAQIKGGKDPDEAARKNLASYKESLKGAVDVWEFIIDTIVARNKARTGPGKAKISREVAPILGKIEDTIVRDHYINYLAKKISVSPESVAEEVSRKSVSDKPFLKEAPPKKEEKERRQLVEEKLLSLFFQFEPQDLKNKEVRNLFKTALAVKLIKKYVSSKKKFEPKSFAKRLPKELQEGFLVMMLKDNDLVKETLFKNEIEQALIELKKIDVKEKMMDLAEKIKKYEEGKKTAKLREAESLFAKYSETLSELD